MGVYIEQIKAGDEVYFAGRFYKVAEIKEFPHGKMIGIYDEEFSNHVDYLNPNSVNIVYHCYNCQGNGCETCNGYGRIIGEKQ